MFKKSMKNKTTYGIIGLGRFGMALALELAKADADLLVIDRNEEKVREMREYTENAFVVPTLDRKTLGETGIQDCDVAVVCIGESMSTSILTTLHLVSMGIPSVIAKATSAEHGEILEKLGAKVVHPEQDMAVRLASEKMAGKTVLEVDFRKKFGANIIAIERCGSLMETVEPGYQFQCGDILFVSGSKEGLNRLSQWAE